MCAVLVHEHSWRVLPDRRRSGCQSSRNPGCWAPLSPRGALCSSDGSSEELPAKQPASQLLIHWRWAYGDGSHPKKPRPGTLPVFTHSTALWTDRPAHAIQWNKLTDRAQRWTESTGEVTALLVLANWGTAMGQHGCRQRSQLTLKLKSQPTSSAEAPVCPLGPPHQSLETPPWATAGIITATQAHTHTHIHTASCQPCMIQLDIQGEGETKVTTEVGRRIDRLHLLHGHVLHSAETLSTPWSA